MNKYAHIMSCHRLDYGIPIEGNINTCCCMVLIFFFAVSYPDLIFSILILSLSELSKASGIL